MVDRTSGSNGGEVSWRVSRQADTGRWAGGSVDKQTRASWLADQQTSRRAGGQAGQLVGRIGGWLGKPEQADEN